MLGGPRQVLLPGTSPGNTQAAFASLKSMRKELDIMGMGAPQSTYSTMAQEVIWAAAEAIEHCTGLWCAVRPTRGKSLLFVFVTWADTQMCTV